MLKKKNKLVGFNRFITLEDNNELVLLHLF